MRWLPAAWRRPVARAARGAEHLRGPGFVALKVESTGLDPGHDAIVAVAAIPFAEGRPQPGYVTLVNPGRLIPPASVATHGVTDAMVRDAPPIGAVLPAVAARCGERVVVGHDLAFGWALLGRDCRVHRRPPLGNLTLDTRRLAAALHPDWADVSLDGVAARLGVRVVGRRTADGEARAAGELLLALLPDLVTRGHRTVAEMRWFQDTAIWARAGQ